MLKLKLGRHLQRSSSAEPHVGGLEGMRVWYVANPSLVAWEACARLRAVPARARVLRSLHSVTSQVKFECEGLAGCTYARSAGRVS